jgi:hypothetical protein
LDSVSSIIINNNGGFILSLKEKTDSHACLVSFFWEKKKDKLTILI